MGEPTSAALKSIEIGPPEEVVSNQLIGAAYSPLSLDGLAETIAYGASADVFQKPCCFVLHKQKKGHFISPMEKEVWQWALEMPLSEFHILGVNLLVGCLNHCKILILEFGGLRVLSSQGLWM